ncbi:hypothetical protein CR513_14377, partial [Mucuna pruriens]
METSSPVSKKDCLRVIMPLVAHFDFELHQMDVKMTFLNGDLEVYTKQPTGFSYSDGEHLKILDNCIYLKVNETKICFLVLYVDDILLTTNDKGLLYKVKQFDTNSRRQKEQEALQGTITKGRLKRLEKEAQRKMDLLKEKGMRFISQFLLENFDIKDIGEASYVIGIKIHRERSQGILSLSQVTYINKVLEIFNMKDCSPSITPIMKGDNIPYDLSGNT